MQYFSCLFYFKRRSIRFHLQPTGPPFLSEEQRVLNAGIIMSFTAGAFAVVAILTGIAVYLALRQGK